MGTYTCSSIKPHAADMLVTTVNHLEDSATSACFSLLWTSLAATYLGFSSTPR